jgi:hypothetical protein
MSSTKNFGRVLVQVYRGRIDKKTCIWLNEGGLLTFSGHPFLFKVIEMFHMTILCYLIALLLKLGIGVQPSHS